MQTLHAICLAGILGLLSMVGYGQGVPALINYQGKLTDTSGQPLSNGTYQLRFSLWDSQSPAPVARLIWGRDYEVTLIGGVFNVILGAEGGTQVDGAAINDLLFAFTDRNRYLGVTIIKNHLGNAVVTPQEILPRQQILSAPFALHSANGCPPGTILAFGGSRVPDGWLACDGSNVSRKSYEELFQALGTTWGNGDGNTTFTLPDMRGRTLLGAGQGPGLSARGIGQGGGAESHQLTRAEMPEHDHAYWDVWYAEHPNFNIWVFSTTSVPQQLGSPSGINANSGDVGFQFQRRTELSGSNQAFSVMQPFAVISYIIKY